MLGHRTLNVEDYLAIFKRRWWIIAIPTVILPIAAIAVTFVIPPVYESQSLVLIDQQKVPEDFVQPIVNEDLDSRVASMNEQILSRSSLQPIVDKYNLYGDQRLDMDARIAKVRNDITLQAIRSEISRSNGLPGFKIFFKASDPRTAQQVCSDLTSLFTRLNVNSREANAEGTTSFIKERLEQAKGDLDNQDAKVAAFTREHFGMLPEDEKSNLDLLSTLNAQLDAATGQLQNMEQTQVGYEAMLAEQSAPVATTSAGAAVQTSQAEQEELAKLLAQRDELTARYSEDYPNVRDGEPADRGSAGADGQGSFRSATGTGCADYNCPQPIRLHHRPKPSRVHWRRSAPRSRPSASSRKGLSNRYASTRDGSSPPRRLRNSTRS